MKKRGNVINILKRKKNVKANNIRKKEEEEKKTQEGKRGSNEFKTALTLNQPHSVMF